MLAVLVNVYLLFSCFKESWNKNKLNNIIVVSNGKSNIVNHSRRKFFFLKITHFDRSGTHYKSYFVEEDEKSILTNIFNPAMSVQINEGAAVLQDSRR